MSLPDQTLCACARSSGALDTLLLAIGLLLSDMFMPLVEVRAKPWGSS